ncbi:MAG TPA: Tol-Pal system protein TolB, partial [Rhodanobacteraceae bacterium]|nr:Tol-Pal system protein TolB [Rhodanobacteraceae bacterium]
MRTTLLSWLGLLLLIPIGGEVFAESLTLEIPNGNASAIPVAVVPFKFEGTTQPPDTDVADVIRGDLNRSGQFRALAKGDI